MWKYRYCNDPGGRERGEWGEGGNEKYTSLRKIKCGSI